MSTNCTTEIDARIEKLEKEIKNLTEFKELVKRERKDYTPPGDVELPIKVCDLKPLRDHLRSVKAELWDLRNLVVGKYNDATFVDGFNVVHRGLESAALRVDDFMHGMGLETNVTKQRQELKARLLEEEVARREFHEKVAQEFKEFINKFPGSPFGAFDVDPDEYMALFPQKVLISRLCNPKYTGGDMELGVINSLADIIEIASKFMQPAKEAIKEYQADRDSVPRNCCRASTSGKPTKKVKVTKK